MVFLNYIKNNLITLIIIIIELIVIIFLLCNVKEEISYDNNIDNYYAMETTNEEYVIYDIKGAIKNPGVYKVLKGTIINDAISTAGGLTKNASTININLGKEVVDRMVIYISTKNELTKKVDDNLTKVVVTDNKPVDDNKAIIDNSNSVGIEVKPKEKESIKEETTNNNTLISINKATKEELTKLPSIGESKAEKIIAYREENGLFNTIEDIKNVSGIGDSLFEKIKEYITI